jgi:two-component system phosphate regulon sensor histidine kinase PhoR
MNNISLEVHGDKGDVYGVRKLLYDIIYNLCDNAIKYNVKDGAVQIEIQDNGSEVLLNVRDTGVGIAPEHTSRVFERFYRVDKSHSKKTGGTGLGLAIVKHAVEYHFGKISVLSKVGAGTEIQVILKKMF